MIMKYLLTPEEYKLPNPRIDGFRKLKEVSARTVGIFVFSLQAFTHFLKTAKLPVEFEQELIKTSEELIKNSSHGKVNVRRAFVVPGLENPPGPYFIGLTSSRSVVEAVLELYKFAISQNYHQASGSQISGFLLPFVDPPRFDREGPDIANIPYGGYAVIQNDLAEIYAVYGNNEGVQSLVADRYAVEVRGNKSFILRKEIPQKSLMYCTTERSQRDELSVPVEIQFTQVLSDNEILEVARVLSSLEKKYGPQRVEFSFDGESLSFNEVADYWKETEADQDQVTQVKGIILSINSIEDLSKLKNTGAEKLKRGEYIVLVGKEIIANRNYDILGTLAANKDNLYVLYPGVAATQHAMRVLADKGHKAFLVGNQKFEENDEVQITTAGGKVRVTNLTRSESQKLVSLWDASLFGVELCGGKADRLSKLKILGFQVPHGSVLTTLVFDELAKDLELSLPVPLASFPGAHDFFQKFPESAKQKIASLVSDYINSGKRFAVRSSATIEDDSKDSMAGMFETFLNIVDGQLVEGIIKVFQSSFGPVIGEHLKSNPGLAEKLKMAVVVQEMVPARAAGVIFGAKIQTGNENVVEIEANHGLGEGIVSGQAKEVEQYKFSRSDKKMIERKGLEILSTAEARALFMLSERLRAEFNGVPQDIEWAIDQQGQIWVLQSRDLFWGK
jgi:hypothetical protein